MRDMPKPFHELQSELLHLFQCLGVETKDGMGCLNSIFKMRLNENFVNGEKIQGVRAAKDRFR